MCFFKRNGDCIFLAWNLVLQKAGIVFPGSLENEPGSLGVWRTVSHKRYTYQNKRRHFPKLIENISEKIKNPVLQKSLCFERFQAPQNYFRGIPLKINEVFSHQMDIGFNFFTQLLNYINTNCIFGYLYYIDYFCITNCLIKKYLALNENTEFSSYLG